MSNLEEGAVRNLLNRLSVETEAVAQASIWREVGRLARAAVERCSPPRYSPASGLMIRIPGDPCKELRPNLRLHYLERARRVAHWRSVARLAWLQGERREFTEKVRMEIIVRRARPVDPDGILSSLKSTIDGLIRTNDQPGPLRGDTAKDIEYAPVKIESGKQWRGYEEVLLYLTVAQSDPDSREFWGWKESD